MNETIEHHKPSQELITSEKIERSKKALLTNEQYLEHSFAKNEMSSYVFDVSKDNKNILYFGSEHTNKVGDPMFEQISQSFAKAKPQIVYVEGMNSINNRKNEIRNIGKDMSIDEAISYGESTYTLKLAVDANVDFESPEPDFKQEIQHILKQGYSKKDIFNFYTYRDIAQYQRQYDAKNMEGLIGYLAPHFDNFKKESGWSDNEIELFKQELFAHIDLESDEYAVDVSPVLRKDREQKVTNHISQVSSHFRDEHMIGRIAEGLKKYDRIFVVYGGSHAVVQEPALKTLLS